MTYMFEISDIIPAEPAEIYHAWLDSYEHSQMTGSPAKAGARVGETFTAWDGYISGKNLDLTPDRRILQAWRTTDFARTAPDSILEIQLEAVDGGTRVTLHHSNLPDDGDTYIQGWIDYYFTPMKEYFKG